MDRPLDMSRATIRALVASEIVPSQPRAMMNDQPGLSGSFLGGGSWACNRQELHCTTRLHFKAI